METKNTPEQPAGMAKAAKKPEIMVEIAGGFLLGSTIMSFLALWTVGIAGIASTPLI